MASKNKIVDEEHIAAFATDLRSILGSLRHHMRQSKGTEIGDFTPSQMAVLNRLYRNGPATLTTLASGEGIRSQSMGAIISVLEKTGLVTGTPHPTDGRQTILALTDRAIDRVEASRMARDDWLFRAITAKLNPEEQLELMKLSELLKRLADY